MIYIGVFLVRFMKNKRAKPELHPKSWTEKTTFGGAVFL